jgi:saccharopine dehydrogenase-like NADP-dependent oxidoreductase
MSAMRVIHDVKRRGGKVVSFTSYCGGLPAPDANNNPFGYKLSWAPRGVLLASRNDAHFLRDGADVTIQGKDLFDNYEVHEVQGMTLEAYPNRNSKQYIDIYEVPHTRTMIRGTYRNRNWCATVKKLVDLGFLDMTERQDLAGRTYANVMAALLGCAESADLKAEVAKRLALTPEQAFITDNLAWLGLFSGTERVGAKITTLLDAVCQLFVEKLQYAPGERDMLVMQHKFEAEFEGHRETITSSLVDYGIANGDTSMSRTVSLPVAIAARLVLDGRFTRPGLSIPTCPELYVPILNELESFDIRFVEKTVKHLRTGGPGSH